MGFMDTKNREMSLTDDGVTMRSKVEFNPTGATVGRISYALSLGPFLFCWRTGCTEWTRKSRRVNHGWISVPSIGNDRPIEDSANVIYFGGPLQSPALGVQRATWRSEVTHEGLGILPSIRFGEIEIEHPPSDIIAHHLANKSSRLRTPSIEICFPIYNAIKYVRCETKLTT